jgi:ectoine hydroxylase-related dioxygenase (phytanoyl-CoA dioxygenase family)
VFAPAKFAALKTHFDAKLADLPAGMRPESMDVPHFLDPKLFEWLFDDAVLDLVEPILGPNLALFSSHFICKPAGIGKRVPWHEDSAYWRTMLAPMEVVTVWLAIDDSAVDNGCMRVIPGTHTGGYSKYQPVDRQANVFQSEIVQVDEAKAVDFVLAENQASLHDGRIIHGSNANTSARRRCGYTMRYISTATRFNRADYPQHQIYLARGKDLAGQPYADPSRAYPEIIENRLKRWKGD